jgi:hypothetical protein
MVGGPPLSSQGATTITLEALIGNSGNLAVGTAATVSFYDGDPDKGGTQIGSDQVVSLQGCGEQGRAQVEWGPVAPGEYTVYVQVETGQAELDEANNQRSMEVRFYEDQLLLPNIGRTIMLP